jgi:hypothetical protein
MALQKQLEPYPAVFLPARLMDLLPASGCPIRSEKMPVRIGAIEIGNRKAKKHDCRWGGFSFDDFIGFSALLPRLRFRRRPSMVQCALHGYSRHHDDAAMIGSIQQEAPMASGPIWFVTYQPRPGLARDRTIGR